MIEFLSNPYTYPFNYLSTLPIWLSHLFIGILLTFKVCLGGWVAIKAGRTPLWGVVLLIPYLDLLAIWIFAFVPWPALQKPHSPSSFAHPNNKEKKPHYEKIPPQIHL